MAKINKQIPNFLLAEFDHKVWLPYRSLNMFKPYQLGVGLLYKYVQCIVTKRLTPGQVNKIELVVSTQLKYVYK